MQTRAQKQAEVEQLREKVARANSMVAVDYRGLTVAQANDLRTKLRDAGEAAIEYRVAKNTLLKRATADTPAASLETYLTGPTALAIAYDEPSTLAKLLVDFAKDHEKFEIKGGVVEGELVDHAAIAQLAALPGRDELRGMLAGTLQAPLRNLAGTLQALLGHVRNALEARQQQLESQS